jgi:hypothetical protein
MAGPHPRSIPGILDPYLKLGRAKVHIEALDLELKRFLRKGKPYTFDRYDDLAKQRHVLCFKHNDVPDAPSLIVGDALYCMRSALDQLVWSLAHLTLAVPNLPANTTQFPILSSPPTTPRDIERWDSQVRDVPDRAIEEIKAFQPYNRGTSYKAHPLWRLNALGNMDKHRRIPANGGEILVQLPKATRQYVTVESFDDCHVVSAPLAHKDKLQLHPRITVTVNFGSGDPAIHADALVENRDGLWEIYNFVADTVVPRFVRFFA